MSTPQRPPDRGTSALTAFAVISGFVAALYVIELVDTLMSNRLDQEGVHPQQTDGLVGILFAPLLHGGWGHLIGNTVPLLVLGFLVLLSGVRTWLAVTAIVWVVGGLGTWLIAPPNTVHLGASVLIFGWLVFLIVRGFVSGRVGQIALGLLILFLYGGVLWGVLPGQPGISWQAHLFGAIGGAIAAFVVVQPRRRTPAPLA
ncbi:rhomboid family intramembrane serine protease [Nocardioides guangzhouensis]|uniref:Rhomboid family intramembrane serine protease n=1 Tax=Nocardioides guangzhouensis TaxID=2497878 RepID=A0A4V1XZL8_9ACTN|nr:rhomboid family intramembrane serine protease [Nocardioides guangzhouensis]RYP87199.1 rhomboid family intramembrane serine protease [Nocardioides guangzhouensis]